MTVDEQFMVFWKEYPNKKGRGDAQKAFKAAIKLTTLNELLEAITKYKANKPEWQAFKYPASWLRGQHWHDEWQSTSSPLTTTRHQTREEYLAAEAKRAARSWH